MPDDITIDPVPTTSAPMSDQASAANPAAGGSDDLDLDVYRRRLLEDLGADKLPPEEQKEFDKKIQKLVTTRIVNLILLYMPDAKLEELTSKMEGDNMDELIDFVGENVPAFQDKLVEELVAIHNELVDGTRDANAAGK